MRKKKHPELRPGEVFLGNLTTTQSADANCSWKTKRVGEKAYDVNGARLPMMYAKSDCLYPVFVQKAETDKKSYGVID